MKLKTQKLNNMKTFQELLKELRACSEAKEWAGEMTIEEVVNTCHRGDWLLWLAKKVNIDNRNLTLAKGLCANTVRRLMKDERSIKAVDAAIAYGKGKATDEELANAAYDSAYAAAYAASAAYAAAYAADAAANAAYAAAYAAANAAAYDAANAAAYAAYAAANDIAAADAAEIENLLQTANICREVIGKEIIEKVNELLK